METTKGTQKLEPGKVTTGHMEADGTFTTPTPSTQTPRRVTIEGFNGDLWATPKIFSTGSRGFFAGGKAEYQGKRYQVSVNITEIGSKPGSKVKA